MQDSGNGSLFVILFADGNYCERIYLYYVFSCILPWKPNSPVAAWCFGASHISCCISISFFFPPWFAKAFLSSERLIYLTFVQGKIDWIYCGLLSSVHKKQCLVLQYVILWYVCVGRCMMCILSNLPIQTLLYKHWNWFKKCTLQFLCIHYLQCQNFLLTKAFFFFKYFYCRIL